MQVSTGEVKGAVQPSSSSSFLVLIESGRNHETVIPMSSIGSIRIEQTTPAPIENTAGTTPLAFTSNASPSSLRAAKASALESFEESVRLPTDGATVDKSLDFIFGQPTITDPTRFRFTPSPDVGEVEGIKIYQKRAFTLGHYEKYRVPAWVAMKWTKENRQSPNHFNRRDFDFETDFDLPSYARAPTNLRHSEFGYERGHQARNQDLYAFGFTATEEGFLMSNIVPQKQPGHATWGHLENEHRNIVVARSDIKELWGVSGPIFKNDEPLKIIRNQGREIAAPHSTYKVIGWFSGDSFHCRGYIIDQEDDIDRRDLDLAIRAVDTIEDATGIDFFHELPNDQEAELESRVHSRLWDDMPVVTEPAIIVIGRVLPNPFGNDQGREAVTLVNPGSQRVRLQGWRLEDADGFRFDLSRFFVNGRNSFDVFLRNSDLSLDNEGDTIKLINQGGEVVDEFKYEDTDVVEGQFVSAQ